MDSSGQAEPIQRTSVRRLAGELAGPVTLTGGLLLVPLLLGEYVAYQLSLYLLYGIVAQGIALVWGRMGFLPLGQAVFFGLAAYLSGFALKSFGGLLLWTALLGIPLVPAVVAWAVGRLVFKGRHDSGPQASLITLAMAMLAAQLANEWSNITGGFNGLTDIPELPGIGRYDSQYVLIATVALVATAGFAWLNRTPLGLLWSAVGQNENRLQFFGYSTDRLKALGFGISAFAAGVAGMLYAPLLGLVTPQSMGVTLSAELVIWTAVGGRFGPYGALCGALAIGMLSAELRDVFTYWEALVALVFIVVVLRFPEGIVGAVKALALRFRIGPAPGTWLTAPEDLARDARPAPPSKAPRSVSTLRFSGVEVSARGVRILDGLHLHVDKPGIHCVIGPNGAGKTSAFNAMTGRLPLRSGSIRIDEADVSGFRADAMARRGVSRKFQVPSIFTRLSVRENLLIAIWANRAGLAELLGSEAWHWTSPVLVMALGQFPFLGFDADRAATELSHGQRQMLELSMALLSEPRLLLLDEPCAGLSPTETQQQVELIRSATRRLGTVVLLIEHDMAAVERLADRVHVLHQGRLLASGTLDEIRRNAAVRKVYEGGRK